jgi:hypothetical protein
MAGIFGLIAFISVSRNPRFALIHTVDVVQLIACGMCFAVALARLIAARRWPLANSRIKDARQTQVSGHTDTTPEWLQIAEMVIMFLATQGF